MNGVHILNAILAIHCKDIKHSWIKKMMPISGIMLAMFFACTGTALSETAAIYEPIVQNYTEKNYNAVIDALEAIENKNSTAWYILADAYYNEKKYPQALVAVRFARIEAPVKNMAKIFSLTKAIKLQNGQQFSSFKEMAMLFWNAIPERILEIAFMLCWWLFFLSFLIACSSCYCAIFRAIVVGILVFLGGLLLILNYNNHMKVGIIIDQTPLYILPEKNSPTRGNVNAGEEIKLERNSDQSWFKIYQNGIYGWIPAQSAVTIEKDLSLSKVRM